jgi:hypothetical protein
MIVQKIINIHAIRAVALASVGVSEGRTKQRLPLSVKGIVYKF